MGRQFSRFPDLGHPGSGRSSVGSARTCESFSWYAASLCALYAATSASASSLACLSRAVFSVVFASVGGGWTSQLFVTVRRGDGGVDG